MFSILQHKNVSSLKNSTRKNQKLRNRYQFSFEALEPRHLLANAIVAENLLPGNPSSEWDIVGIGDASIQGYATDISVDQGETVEFKIDNQAIAPYRLDIYRVGYYGGDGARQVDTIPSTSTLPLAQPPALVDAVTGLVDAGNWQVSATWDVPANATSGVYIARVVREDTGGASHIIFVVRDDDGESEVLFQTADTTWQAYNRWGGNSFYVGPYNGRAYAVSYNRPFDTRATTAKDWFFSSEYATVRWLEKNGYDVSYFSGVDSDRYGDELLEHDLFLSVGHDEYWSSDQRANVEFARDSGVNLAFLSGNEVYWKTRWESSIDSSGTPYRTLVSYKETWDNAKIDPEPNVWTGTWRDDRFSPPADGGNPENALTGQIFTVNRGPGGDTGTSFTVGSEFSDLRFWRDTRVADLLPGESTDVGDYVLGYEWDEDLDNGFRPAGLFQMSSTTQLVPAKIDQYGTRTTSPGLATHSLTQYRAQSGALVFGAGTINWGWGLDGVHDVVPSVPDQALQQATVNVFADMGVQPESLQADLVYATASFDVTAPSSAILVAPTLLQGGQPVTIQGTAADTEGVVSAVEITVDGGKTWRRADGRDNWTFEFTPTQAGPITVRSRAVDDSGNLEIPTSGVSPTVQLVPTSSNGLVASFGFNEGSGTTLVDTSGNSNDGVISGASFTTGFSGQALSFDGIDDIVTIADSNSLDLTSGMTLQAWIQPQDLDGWTTVLLKERLTSNLAYGLYASDDSLNPPIGLIDTSSGLESVRSSSLLPLNTWSHLAVTFDAEAMQLFVNGDLVRSEVVSENILTTNGDLQIGGNNIYPDEFFNGLIDEIRVYNRALTQAEIFYDMSTPVDGTVDTTAPVGAISSPVDGSNVSGSLVINVSASDDIAVGKVALMLDGEPLSDDSSFPFQTTLNTLAIADGVYVLSGSISDVVGNAITLAPVSFTVSNQPDVTAPLVSFLTSQNGDFESSWIVLDAFASDDRLVEGVRFQVNGTDIGSEDVAEPYRVAWDSTTVSDGIHQVTAIARDAAGNTTSETIELSVDNTTPTVISITPADGQTDVLENTNIMAAFDESINQFWATMELRNDSSQLVPAVVTYDEELQQLELNPEQNLIANATYTVSIANIIDPSGNQLSDFSWTITMGDSGLSTSLWNDQVVPAIPSANDSSAIEVGVEFQSSLNGFVKGVRFYKGINNTGSHVGSLWDQSGTLLATATFESESETGWQSVEFTSPIAITANTSYVASYFAPNGGYAVDSNYFQAQYDAGPLTAFSNSNATIGNGLYFYGANGAFPANSFGASNYWVDTIFSTSINDQTAPTVVSTTPPASANDISRSIAPSATFSEDVVASSIQFELRDAVGALVASTNSYNPANQTVTLTPDGLLSNLETYTATISDAEDLAQNSMDPFSWMFTTSDNSDVTPPVITSSSPNDGTIDVDSSTNITVSFDETIDFQTMVFTVQPNGGQPVGSSLSYDSGTNTVTLDPTSALLPSTSYEVDVTGCDLSGNCTTDSWSFVTSAVSTLTIWDGSVVPAVPSANDTGAVELGVKFRSASDGFVSALRFYKGALNTGTHIGRLWSSGGNLLAEAVFTNESTDGWQQVNFASPIAIAANTTYVASYYAPNGGYGVDSSYFVSGSEINGVLSALGDGIDGGNGVYLYGTGGGFPSSSLNASNYWVDLVFSSALVDSTSPTVVSQTPADSATGVSTATDVVATLSESVQANTITFTLEDGSGNSIPASFVYDDPTRTVTLTANGLLNNSTTYTATIGGAADLAGNAMQPFSWSFTTQTAADVTAPTITSRSPADGVVDVAIASNVSVTFDEPIQFSAMTYTLIPNGGSAVANSLSYNNSTFTATLGPTDDLLPQTNYVVAVSAADLSGNSMSDSWEFTTGDILTDQTIWSPADTPLIASANDTSAVELGVKFQSSTAGYVTGLRFYKGSLNTGSHVGNLWTANGTLLGAATFTNETSTGWQEVGFGSPIAVAANTTYVASYYAPNGGYAVDGTYFASGSFVNGLLTALGDGVEGGNGVYGYGVGGGFPNSSYNASNYWVDVVFSTSASDVTAPLVVSQTPADSATGVSTATAVVATLSESVQANTITFTLEDGSGNSIPASFVYDDPSSTVTLTANGLLNNSTTYTATIGGAADLAGNVMTTTAWSFTTIGLISAESIWDFQTTPSVASATDTSAVELGVKFRASTDGDITSLRFYKGALNTGSHLGRIWTASGTLLDTATFTNETNDGWQQVDFAVPIAISANTTYVASYYAPNGGYAFDSSYFSSGSFSNGNLTALGDGDDGGNGVYLYGTNGGFPSSSYKSTNYWVDVVFEASVNGGSSNSITATAIGFSPPVAQSFMVIENVQFETPIAQDTNRDRYRLQAVKDQSKLNCLLNAIGSQTDDRPFDVRNDFGSRTRRSMTRLDNAFASFEGTNDILPSLELSELDRVN